MERHQHRELTTFCGALLDRHEDAIMQALRNDDFGTEAGENLHCQQGVLHAAAGWCLLLLASRDC